MNREILLKTLKFLEAHHKYSKITINFRKELLNFLKEETLPIFDVGCMADKLLKDNEFDVGC